MTVWKNACTDTRSRNRNPCMNIISLQNRPLLCRFLRRIMARVLCQIFVSLANPASSKHMSRDREVSYTVDQALQQRRSTFETRRAALRQQDRGRIPNCHLPEPHTRHCTSPRTAHRLTRARPRKPASTAYLNRTYHAAHRRRLMHVVRPPQATYGRIPFAQYLLGHTRRQSKVSSCLIEDQVGRR